MATLDKKSNNSARCKLYYATHRLEHRQRMKDYYALHRKDILEKAKARRIKIREKKTPPPPVEKKEENVISASLQSERLEP